MSIDKVPEPNWDAKRILIDNLIDVRFPNDTCIILDSEEDKSSEDYSNMFTLKSIINYSAKCLDPLDKEARKVPSDNDIAIIKYSLDKVHIKFETDGSKEEDSVEEKSKFRKLLGSLIFMRHLRIISESGVLLATDAYKGNPLSITVSKPKTGTPFVQESIIGLPVFLEGNLEKRFDVLFSGDEFWLAVEDEKDLDILKPMEKAMIMKGAFSLLHNIYVSMTKDLLKSE
jgi:hypothetical protein